MARPNSAAKKRANKAQTQNNEPAPKRPRRSRSKPVNYKLPELFDDSELEPLGYVNDENDTDEDYGATRIKTERKLPNDRDVSDDQRSSPPPVVKGASNTLKATKGKARMSTPHADRDSPELSSDEDSVSNYSDEDPESNYSDEDTRASDSEAETAKSEAASTFSLPKSQGYKAKALSKDLRLHILEAKQTMESLLEDRKRDIVRHILLKGDMPDDGQFTNIRKSKQRWRLKMLAWPPIGIQRYLNYLGPNPYRALGIDPMKGADPRYGDVELEEPGGEQDAIEIRNFESKKNDPSLSEVAAVEDDMDEAISDPARNGGIGLVIRRTPADSSSGSHGDEKVQFITEQQLKYPDLLAPRYNRAPLRGDTSRNPAGMADHHFKPLTDMIRTHVINQVRSHTGQSRPLSKFVATTVAEESTLGVLNTWESLNSFWQNDKQEKSERLGMLPGTYNTGWLGILEAAAQAGIPDEVLARSYARLFRLCDINVATDEFEGKMKKLLPRDLLRYRMYPKESTVASFEVSGSEADDQDDSEGNRRGRRSAKRHRRSRRRPAKTQSQDDPQATDQLLDSDQSRQTSPDPGQHG